MLVLRPRLALKGDKKAIANVTSVHYGSICTILAQRKTTKLATGGPTCKTDTSTLGLSRLKASVCSLTLALAGAGQR